MKRTIQALSVGLMLAFIAGCGTPDVTGESVDDAMKERAAKAKALDEKEGKAPVDRSAEMAQDPQLGGSAPTTRPADQGNKENPNTGGD